MLALARGEGFPRPFQENRPREVVSGEYRPRDVECGCRERTQGNPGRVFAARGWKKTALLVVWGAPGCNHSLLTEWAEP